MSEKNAVISAISAVMAEVGSVEKRGKNEFHRYDYATAADIMYKLQPLMAKHGLVIIQNEKAVTWIDNNNAMAIQYEFSLAHISGATWPDKPIHTGVSSAKNSKGGFDDKAANKCHTAARKYFLLALFEIPTGDYPDADAEEDKRGAGESKPLTAQRATGQNPPPRDERSVAKTTFTLINNEGEEVQFERAGTYLEAFAATFELATDKFAFWDFNSPIFQEWQTKLIQSDKPNHKQIAAEFNRVGSMISERLHSINRAA